MAAGGGVFTTQNKVLPGAYINFISKARALGTIGERGIVAMPYSSDWGIENKVISLSSEDFQKNAVSILGYSYDSPKLLPLREVFKGAETVKLYRVNGGAKASAKLDGLTVTAVCGGVRGNNINIVIENNIDEEGSFYVRTIIDGNTVADEQTASSVDELLDNGLVSFSGSGALKASAGISLTGGTDTPVTGNGYSDFLNAIEAEDFTTILYAGKDAVTKGLFASFTKRLREEEGYKISCVLHDYPQADFEGVISVENTCDPVDGADENSLVYWVAGMTAGAQVNESLTNKIYDGELSVLTSYKKSELKEALEQGKFIFYSDRNQARVLKDINSFVSVSPEKNSDFKNNQIIRVLDAVANDTARIFDSYYLGRCQNNALGRDIFKTELVNYHQKLMAVGAIENFLPEDITVVKGDEKGDVVVNEYIEPVGAMDKLYMTCIVE